MSGRSAKRVNMSFLNVPFPTETLHEGVTKRILDSTISQVRLEIRESRIPSGGLGIFTTEPIARGEEVFRESFPIVYAPDQADLHKTCDNCFASNAIPLNIREHVLSDDLGSEVVMHPCSNCKEVSFCCSMCESMAWGDHHQYECENRLPANDEEHRMLLRILVKKKMAGFTQDEWEVLTRMTAHTGIRLELPGGELDLDLVDLSQGDVGTDLEEGVDIYHKILENHIAIKNPPQPSFDSDLGSGIYALASFLNHSCKPNVFIITEGIELRCRTYEDIPAGEEFVIAYVNPEFDVDRRRKRLAEDHFFTCNCARCLLDEIKPLPGDMSAILSVLESELLDAKSMDQIANICDRVEMILYDSNDDLQWLAYVEPVGAILSKTGRAYAKLGAHEQALKAFLCACFRTERSKWTNGRRGVEWVECLFNIVSMLRPIAEKHWAKHMHRNVFLASRRWTVYMMYLVILRGEIAEWYGDDSAFYVAMDARFRAECAGGIAVGCNFDGQLWGTWEAQSELFELAGIGDTVERFNLGGNEKIRVWGEGFFGRPRYKLTAKYQARSRKAS